jgi:hypothetical protein
LDDCIQHLVDGEQVVDDENSRHEREKFAASEHFGAGRRKVNRATRRGWQQSSQAYYRPRGLPLGGMGKWSS